MQLFVEAGRLSATHFTGISNVIAQALLAWADASPKDEFVVASHSEFNEAFAIKARLRKNIILRIDPVPAWIPKGAKNAWWFYTCLPTIVRRLAPDWYWASSSLVPFGLPKNLSVVTTIYDLVPILHRNTMSIKGRIITKISFRHAIRRANTLWTISHYVKDQLQSTVPESISKPIVVACAIDHEQFKPQGMNNEERMQQLRKMAPAYKDGPSLLFVGTTEPRKNLSFLISLMPDLAHLGINLFVVGAKGWGNALSAEAVAIASNPDNRVHFVGRISNDELAKLYASVDFFISTSLDEGFCMPAVEAMACGTPTILARNSAMQEVVGNGGISVAYFDQTEWYSAITAAFATSHEFNPINQARHYSWLPQIMKVVDQLKQV